MKTIILFGASSAIAKAYIKHLDDYTAQFKIVCVSSGNFASSLSANIEHFATDYSAESLASLTQFLKRC